MTKDHSTDGEEYFEDNYGRDKQLSPYITEALHLLASSSLEEVESMLSDFPGVTGLWDKIQEASLRKGETSGRTKKLAVFIVALSILHDEVIGEGYMSGQEAYEQMVYDFLEENAPITISSPIEFMNRLEAFADQRMTQKRRQVAKNEGLEAAFERVEKEYQEYHGIPPSEKLPSGLPLFDARKDE